MFNLLGSFFFGRSSEQPTTVNNETQTSQLLEESALSSVPHTIDTQSNATDSTTTSGKSFEDALQMHQLMVTSQTMDCELHKQWVIVERAKQQLQQQQQQLQTQTTTHLDDVKEEEEVTSPVGEEEQVVISSEQDEVEMKEEEDEEELSPKRLSEEEDDDVLLGSFFDRNETDSTCVQQEVEQPQQPAVQPTRQDEWLITPLPCLTSITCSQRSLVDTDPLENLLIEHPSMSVFVTVTSSAMSESAALVTPTKPSQESAVFKVFSENVEKKIEEKKESSLGKSVSQRKRKGMETTTTNTTTTSPSPTSTMRRKANKRNKKSPVSLASPVATAVSPVAATVPVVASGQQQQQQQSPSSNNKENTQVRTLLSSEFRSKANPASKLDSILLGKNQMKRNNKHANKFNSNNSIQRKFHKLQQPVCC